jgi:hypothetical protein
MSRRESLEHDTGRDDHDMVNPTNISMSEERYLRLRCLELAVRMDDPDAPVSVEAMELRANALMSYITKGYLTEPELVEAGKPE